MSNENDKLDDLFRSRFEDVELPVSDNLLANIKKELDIPKRKSRFGAWLWIASFLAIVGLAGVVIYYANSGAYKQKEDRAIVVAADSAGNAAAENENVGDIKVIRQKESDELANDSNKAVSEQVMVEQNKQEEGTETTKELADIPKTADEKKQAVPLASEKNNIAGKENKKSGAGNEIPMNTRAAKVGAPSDKKGKGLNKEKQKGISGAESATVHKNEAVKQDNQVKQSVAGDKTNKSLELEKITGNSSEPSKVLEGNTKDITANTQVESGQEGNKKEDKNITGTETTTAVTAKTESKQLDSTKAKLDSAIVLTTPRGDTLAKQKEEPKNEIKEPKNYAFFADLNGGLSQSFRALEIGDNLIRQKVGEESALLTYNAGIDAGILFKKKYQFTMGLGIDNKGEKYKFPGQDAVYETNDSMVIGWDSVMIGWDSINMDTIWEYDTVHTPITYTQQVQEAIAAKDVKNKYQYFRIPVMFGYRIKIGEKLFVTPNAGVIANFLVSGSATWFDRERQLFITYNTKNYYRPFVLAARARIDIGFNLNDNWGILLQPGYTRFLQSIYRKEESFKHYPYSYDLNMAVRYTF
jgi:hypothetical protein